MRRALGHRGLGRLRGRGQRPPVLGVGDLAGQPADQFGDPGELGVHAGGRRRAQLRVRGAHLRFGVFDGGGGVQGDHPARELGVELLALVDLAQVVGHPRHALPQRGHLLAGLRRRLVHGLLRRHAVPVVQPLLALLGLLPAVGDHGPGPVADGGVGAAFDLEPRHVDDGPVLGDDLGEERRLELLHVQ